MTRFPILSFCLSLFLSISAFADMPLANSKEELANRVEAIRHLAPYKQWRFIQSYPLSSEVHTGHPQGLIVQNNRVVLSTQGSKVGELLWYEAKGNDLSYKTKLSFDAYSSNRHVGGIHLAKDRNTILLPLSGTGAGDTTMILAVDLEKKDIQSIASLPFHIGTMLYDSSLNSLYGIDYTKNVYNLSLATQSFQDFRLNRQNSFSPSLDTEYQDCKSLGGDGYFLCAGKDANSLGSVRGYIDLIHMKPDGSYAKNEIVRIPVPHVEPSGAFGDNTGIYVPGFMGTPPLSFNAFDFAFLEGRRAVRFYFAPHDNPNTTLLVYDAEIL